MTHEVSVPGVRAVFEPACGHLPVLEIGGAQVLHAAPWRDDARVQADRAIPMVDRRLGGSFLCAPFGVDDLTGGPPHGTPANTRWIVKRAAPGQLRARLAQNVQGARVSLALALREGHPALYQTWEIAGGTGAMTYATHPMVRMAAGGRISYSPKRLAVTPSNPLEIGRNYWNAGQVVAGAMLRVGGAEVDLRDYPDVPCEDFVTLIEAVPKGLGWTAVARTAEEDTVLFLRDAQAMPMTMLWVSNGGRAASPWNGRHRGVLGVEDGMCAGAEGFAAAAGGSDLGRVAGVPTAVRLEDGPHILRHAIVRVPGARELADVRLGDEGLEVEDVHGETDVVAFDTGFFA